MQVRTILANELSDILVPVHRDGWKFLAMGLVLMVLLFWIWTPLGVVAALATLWLAYFFRDPDRVTPLRDGLIVAAADGRIAAIETIVPPAELGLGEGQRTRISTVLSVFDVHINRAPMAGRILRSLYVPGAFLNPTLDKSSAENERRALIIGSPQAQGADPAVDSAQNIAVVQIAGILSRRIVTFAGEGDSLGIGQRFGLIRFGSRVDVYLPVGLAPLVAVGQRSLAGETVLADLKAQEGAREGRRS